MIGRTGLRSKYGGMVQRARHKVRHCQEQHQELQAYAAARGAQDTKNIGAREVQRRFAEEI